MAGGWPSRIVGRLVGLRGGTARQSRLRGSVLGSAASRCVDFPSLPHSHTAFSVVPTFRSFATSLDSRHFTFVTRSLISFLTFVSLILLVLASLGLVLSLLSRLSRSRIISACPSSVVFLSYVCISHESRSASLLCSFSFAPRKAYNVTRRDASATARINPRE